MSEKLKLPPYWAYVPIASCIDLNQSGTWGDEAKSDGSDFPVLRSTNIQDGQMVLDDIAYRNIKPSIAAKYTLSDGDILITKSSGSTHLIGKNILFSQPSDNKSYLFSNFTQRLRCRRDIILPEYLYYFINSQYTQRFLEHIQNTTSGLRNLDMNLYVSQKIPLPPLSEQHRIAAILRATDELRRLRRQTDQRARDLLPALFQQMFGYIDELKQRWKSIKVEEAGYVQLGRQRAPQYQTGKFTRPYVRVANVFENRIDISDLLTMDFNEADFKKYRLEYGDILLNEGQSLELVGRPAMWRNEVDNCCFQNTLIRFRANPEKTDPNYALAVFLFYFRTGRFSTIGSQTSNVAHLGAARFSKMDFPLPPLEIQREFARRIVLQREDPQADAAPARRSGGRPG